MEIFYSAFVVQQPEEWIGQTSYVTGRGLATRHISDTNLNWFIKAIIDNSLQEILAVATGSTFPNVGKDLLNNFQIVIPDTSTLEKFGEKGYTISQLISQNAKEIDHLFNITGNAYHN